METSWLRELRRGKKPDSGKLVEHLQKVHRENPGFTEKYSANCVDSAGMNTYQWLAEVIEKEGRSQRDSRSSLWKRSITLIAMISLVVISR